MNALTPAKNGMYRKTALSGKVRTVEAARGPTAYQQVTTGRMRSRAYEIYLQRASNGSTGDAMSDWLQAERELNGVAPDPSAASDAEARAQARGETLLASGE